MPKIGKSKLKTSENIKESDKRKLKDSKSQSRTLEANRSLNEKQNSILNSIVEEIKEQNVLEKLQGLAAFEQFRHQNKQLKQDSTMFAGMQHMSEQNYVAVNQVATEVMRLHGFLAGDSPKQLKMRERMMKAERHNNLQREQDFNSTLEAAIDKVGVENVRTISELRRQSMKVDRVNTGELDKSGKQIFKNVSTENAKLAQRVMDIIEVTDKLDILDKFEDLKESLKSGNKTDKELDKAKDELAVLAITNDKLIVARERMSDEDMKHVTRSLKQLGYYDMDMGRVIGLDRQRKDRTSAKRDDLKTLADYYGGEGDAFPNPKKYKDYFSRAGAGGSGLQESIEVGFDNMFDHLKYIGPMKANSDAIVYKLTEIKTQALLPMLDCVCGVEDKKIEKTAKKLSESLSTVLYRGSGKNFNPGRSFVPMDAEDPGLRWWASNESYASHYGNVEKKSFNLDKSKMFDISSISEGIEQGFGDLLNPSKHKNIEGLNHTKKSAELFQKLLKIDAKREDGKLHNSQRGQNLFYGEGGELAVEYLRELGYKGISNTGMESGEETFAFFPKEAKDDKGSLKTHDEKLLTYLKTTTIDTTGGSALEEKENEKERTAERRHKEMLSAMMGGSGSFVGPVRPGEGNIQGGNPLGGVDVASLAELGLYGYGGKKLYDAGKGILKPKPTTAGPKPKPTTAGPKPKPTALKKPGWIKQAIKKFLKGLSPTELKKYVKIAKAGKNISKLKALFVTGGPLGWIALVAVFVAEEVLFGYFFEAIDEVINEKEKDAKVLASKVSTASQELAIKDMEASDKLLLPITETKGEAFANFYKKSRLDNGLDLLPSQMDNDEAMTHYQKMYREADASGDNKKKRYAMRMMQHITGANASGPNVKFGKTFKHQTGFNKYGDRKFSKGIRSINRMRSNMADDGGLALLAEQTFGPEVLSELVPATEDSMISIDGRNYSLQAIGIGKEILKRNALKALEPQGANVLDDLQKNIKGNDSRIESKDGVTNILNDNSVNKQDTNIMQPAVLNPDMEVRSLIANEY
jgi:hypothetical protein